MLALSFTHTHTHTSYHYYIVFAGSKLTDLVIPYNKIKGTDKSQEALYLIRRVETAVEKGESVRPGWQSPFKQWERENLGQKREVQK